MANITGRVAVCHVFGAGLIYLSGQQASAMRPAFFEFDDGPPDQLTILPSCPMALPGGQAGGKRRNRPPGTATPGHAAHGWCRAPASGHCSPPGSSHTGASSWPAPDAAPEWACWMGEQYGPGNWAPGPGDGATRRRGP